MLGQLGRAEVGVNKPRTPFGSKARTGRHDRRSPLGFHADGDAVGSGASLSLRGHCPCIVADGGERQVTRPDAARTDERTIHRAPLL